MKMWCYFCHKWVDWNYNDPHGLGWNDHHCAECDSFLVDREPNANIQRVVDKIKKMEEAEA